MIVFYSGEGNIVNKYIYSSGLQKIDKKEGKKKKKTGNNKILGYIKEAPHCFLSLRVVKRERVRAAIAGFVLGLRACEREGRLFLSVRSSYSNPILPTQTLTHSFLLSFIFGGFFLLLLLLFFLFDFLNLLICRFYFIDAFGLYILINHHLHLYLHKNQKTLIGNGYHHG